MCAGYYYIYAHFLVCFSRLIFDVFVCIAFVFIFVEYCFLWYKLWYFKLKKNVRKNVLKNILAKVLHAIGGNFICYCRGVF